MVNMTALGSNFQSKTPLDLKTQTRVEVFLLRHTSPASQLLKQRCCQGDAQDCAYSAQR